MNVTGALFLLSLLFSAWFMFRRLRVNFTLSSVGLFLLLAFHGPAYWYYTRYWIHGTTFLNKLYDASASVTGGRNSGGVRAPDAPPVYDHLARLSGDPAFASSIAHLDIAMALLFLGVVAGILLADLVFSSNQAQMNAAIVSWQDSKLSPSLRSRNSKLIFWSILIMCSALLVSLYLKTDKFELVYKYFFTVGSEMEKIQWRRESGGFSYAWNIFFATIALFATVYAMNELRFNKAAGMPLTVIFVILIIFGKMAYLSKAPVVVYALQICLAVLIARSLNVSRYAAATLLAILVLVALVMIFVANSAMEGVGNALIFLFYRLLMIPNESLVEYFLAIPNYLPHTNGLDNRFIALLVGEPKLLESYWRVAEVLRGVGGSTTTAMFVADAWAEFSWLGVVIFPIAFGWVLRSLDILLVGKLGKTSASIAGLSLGYYGIFIALSTSLFTAFLTGGILMIPFLVFIGGFVPAWTSGRRSAAS